MCEAPQLSSVSRSVSPGIIGAPYPRPAFTQSEPDIINRRVHLIQSDLWEAITGEKLSPAILCNLCECAMPYVDTVNPNSNGNTHYLSMAQDRTGSRLLQQKVPECSDQEREAIFNSLLPHLNELVYDQSANYVIQKLCEYANPEHQKVFLDFFLSELQRVVDHPNGCRVLQKFIECTTKQNISMIFVALRNNLVALCSSQNGNHIVQRFIESLPDQVPEIIVAIEPHVLNLVVDNCGCRVVQRLFDKFPIAMLRSLVIKVLSNAAELATNQYGNYVVQNILESGSSDDITALIHAFTGHFYKFSIHKFASNVIEKCIRRATGEQRDLIFSEIIGKDDHFEDDRILQMVSDQFGNYVIQRIIEFGTEAQQGAIFDVVYDAYDDLISRGYAKHVITKLENVGYDFNTY